MKDIENLSDNYKTIYGHLENEFEEKKSIFITDAKYVDSEDEALEFIEEIRKKYNDATHNCTAYIINKNPIIKRYNDDGEPTYSAGMPILSVLEKENLKNVVVVVTRYFGGKKLGKGGLVRAYTKATTDCINKKIVEKKAYVEVELIYDYTNAGIIDNFILDRKYHIIDKNYTDKVSMRLYIDKEKFENFSTDIINLTSNNIIINKKEIKMLFSHNQKIIKEA
ncbi:MAG: YigZ family protein [Tissierellia bacterium]|nr:YigZ family protein [Tissierellia bacterium]